MEWNEYLELSEKTLSKEFHCTSKQTEFLLHAVMGVITELEELLSGEGDEVNKGEEIADICWYLAIISREFNIDFPKYEFRTIYDGDVNTKMVISMYKNSSVLLDLLKKKIYYNKPLSEDTFVEKTIHLMHDVNDYCKYNSINISLVLDLNIAKLKARYGEKFSSDRAINRDLETERNILEGK